MSGINVEEYASLNDTGYASNTPNEPKAPEEEFFHSVYICGQSRTNQTVKEEYGKLQIRGVAYNKTEVHMIITHIKDVNVKNVASKGQGRKNKVECFSYKTGTPPFHGTTKLENGEFRTCPENTSARSLVPFCNPCRNQLIVAGILCDPSGKPIRSNDNKLVFVFIRGKGVKYKNVMDYVDSLAAASLPPMIQPQNDKSKEFERRVLNHKRFVTKISVGTSPSSFGDKQVFVLEASQNTLSDNLVKDILDISKKTLEKFNEKFDWTATMSRPPSSQFVVSLEEDDTQEIKSEEESLQSEATFNFGDIKFP